MPIWTKCLSDTLYYDNSPADERGSCRVSIDKEHITVTYDDDHDVVTYSGIDHGNGHFSLKCPERKGEASLHMFKDGNILEGYWFEGGTRGMWRIKLA